MDPDMSVWGQPELMTSRFSGMAPIAAGGESCRNVRSDPTIDIERAMRGTDARTTLQLAALLSVLALTLDFLAISIVVRVYFGIGKLTGNRRVHVLK
jgi:hypothetical protein